MNISSEDVVRLIVWYASRRGEKLTTLRLVKFLYLADLYHARVSKGTTLPGWPWAFVHFGPYCQEAMSAIDRAGKNDSFQVNPFDPPPTGRGLLRVDGERHTNNLTPCTARGMSRTVKMLDAKLRPPPVCTSVFFHHLRFPICTLHFELKAIIRGLSAFLRAGKISAASHLRF